MSREIGGVEGRDFVVCAVCGKRFKRISATHLKKHGITTDEYVKKYPDSQLTCYVSKDKQSESRSKFLNENPDALFKLKTLFSGRNHTEETKELLRLKNTGRSRTDEEKLEMEDLNITIWLEKNQGEHFCECGCGGLIKLERRHHPNIPRFILGHNTKTEEFKVGARIRGKRDVQRLIDGSEVYWSNEENRERRSDEVIQYYKDHPEAGIQHSQRIIDHWNNLTDNEKIIRSQKQSAGHQRISYEEWSHFLCDETDWRDWDKAVYLNDWFRGCNRHHITETIVVCIPVELHQHVKHNLKTGDNMPEMNMLALQYINGCYND